MTIQVLLDIATAYGPAAAENKNTLERCIYKNSSGKERAYRSNGLQTKNVFVGVGSIDDYFAHAHLCRPGQDKILQTLHPRTACTGSVY
jgi:hypothetical protein